MIKKKKFSTIEKYEKMRTEKLQRELLSLETALENIELIIDSHGGEINLDESKADYEIDISLIRMELNKRFWKKEP